MSIWGSCMGIMTLMHLGGDDSLAELKMIRLNEFARHVSVHIKQSVTDDKQNSFELLLGVAAE